MNLIVLSLDESLTCMAASQDRRTLQLVFSVVLVIREHWLSL